MAINIAGWSQVNTGLTNILEVTSNMESYIRPTTAATYAGYFNQQFVNDAGVDTGNVLVLPDRISTDYRYTHGWDTMLDFDIFNYTNQNTNRHNYRNNGSSMTYGLSGTALVTNSGGTTATDVGAAFSTCRYFPLYSKYSTYIEFVASLSASIPTNTVINFGLFQASNISILYIPVDGIGFRYTSSGLTGFLNINTTEFITPIFNFTASTIYHHYAIEIDKEKIFFYVDDILLGSLTQSTYNGTYDQGQMAAAQPMTINHYISALGSAGGVCMMNFQSYSVSLGDEQMNKSWAQILAGKSQTGCLIPNNNASGSYTTLNIPGWNGLVNTTNVVTGGTSVAIGLGGQTQWSPVASDPNTDRIMFAYQNPAATSANTARQLHIDGIKMANMVTSTLGQSLTTFQIDLGYGATTASMSNPPSVDGVESNTFQTGGTTKVFRKIPLGFQSISASAVGTISNDINVTFNVPILVNPGDWIAIVIRETYTTTGGSILTNVEFDSHW